MSVEGIRAIIRRHTGLHPKETGPIPHREVIEMIASANDGDGITSRERAELLAAVAMFGDTVPGRPSLLAPADEAALKAAAISGIETLDLFLAQSKASQESFIVYCVLQGSAEYIGFTQLYIAPGSGDPKVVAYVDQTLIHLRTKLGNDFAPANWFDIAPVVKEGQVYGYIVESTFPKLQSQLTEYCTSVVGAKLDYSKVIYKDLEPPDTD
jgi:hypothetical protein